METVYSIQEAIIHQDPAPKIFPIGKDVEV
jgi:hypothetical protein